MVGGPIGVEALAEMTGWRLAWVAGWNSAEA